MIQHEPASELKDPEIERFIEYLLEERRFSQNTASAYSSDLKQFHEFLTRAQSSPCASSRTSSRLTESGKAEIRLWLRELADSVGSNTLARKMATLRAFFRFTVQSGHARENPAASMRLPKIRRKLPLTISAEVANDLMLTPACDEAPGERDRVILELLYGCGLRVSELISLNLDSIDLETRVIHVRGKGKKERVVPLGRPAASVLLAYISKRREEISRDEIVGASRASGRRQSQPLFLGARGRRLGVRRVQELVQRYGVLATGRANLHPHALRHACATHMLEGGADLRAIQDMLGHETVATTQRYTHLSTQKLTQIYDSAHPLARVSLNRSKKAFSDSGGFEP